MSQQMHSLVQSERGLQQVVLYHFTPRFFHQFMKHNTLCKEASLQYAVSGNGDGNPEGIGARVE